VYLVLQLDSIIFAAGLSSVVAAVATFVFGLYHLFAHIEGDDPMPGATSALKWALGLSLCALLVVTFLPSTKTAAAMIVLPALTSPQVTEPLGREAGELYQLAKDALKRAGAEPAKPAENDNADDEPVVP
jgi:hypothetical protein